MAKRCLKFIGLIITSAVVIVSSSTSVLAVDVKFFSQNDIVHYDPDTCKVTNQSGDVALEGSQNAEKIFRFLISTSFKGLNNKPFNAVQAAGALGNFYQESGFDPGAIEGNGEGHGIAQWSYGRKTRLFKFAADQGKKWDDLGVQLKLVEAEINEGYGKEMLAAKFGSVSDPKEASYIFQKIYERAGTPNQARRDGAAQAYYEKFKSLAPTNNQNAGTPDQGCNGGTSQFVDDGFVIYNQADTRWSSQRYGSGTVGYCGCGPSAIAMAITALTGKSVTPAQTAEYANDNGQVMPDCGSKWSITPLLAKHWNLKTTNVEPTVSGVNSALRAGGIIVTSGKGASPFTSGGHIIIIRGVTATGKWKIGDSNGTQGLANSKAEHEPTKLLDVIKTSQGGNINLVAITK